MRIIAICLAAATLGVAACGGDSEQAEPSSNVTGSVGTLPESSKPTEPSCEVSGSHGTSLFTGRDLVALLKDPPGARKLRPGRVQTHASVAAVWDHGDDVHGAARWKRRLREAGFQRYGRVDFETETGDWKRFSVIVEAIVLRDAAGACEGVAVLRSIHYDYLANNLIDPAGYPDLPRELGPDAWAEASRSDQDVVIAFGFRVGSAAFITGLWGVPGAPPTEAEARAVALEIASRARALGRGAKGQKATD